MSSNHHTFQAGIGATAAALGLLCLSILPAQQPTANEAARVVKAANAFLATLTAEQRKKVVFPYDDQQQRQRWSNFPVSFVRRGGIDLKDMTPAQRAAGMALLETVLSPMGYQKVQDIMDGDEVNKTTDQGPGGGPGGRGQGGPPGRGPGGAPPGGFGPPPGGTGARSPWQGPIFGKDLYYFSFLGTPSQTGPWMLQFGGHHLALNITIDGDRGVLTPTLTGAQPALFKWQGKTVRPLARESDKALALLQSLNEAQRKKAILSFEVADLVLGPGQDGKTIQPEGLKASDLNEQQREMLLDVMSEWAGIIHASAATARMTQLKAELSETWFAWSGSTTAQPGKNITAYYRIQGPHVVIEYAPQGLGGDLSMHVHTMYRDPTNDYGRQFGTR